jgi:hypothetical protein
MSVDVSGYGTQINIIADVTFPLGFVLTEFSDDVDAIDIPSLQIADSAMGLNGDLIKWSKANPIKPTVSVIPNGIDDINLSILLEANRVGKGKLGAQDNITMSIVYPDGRIITLTNGIITDGLPVSSVATAGRIKTKTYAFAFENKTGN